MRPHLAYSSAPSSFSLRRSEELYFHLTGHEGNCLVEDEDNHLVVVPPSIKRKWVRPSRVQVEGVWRCVCGTEAPRRS